VTTLREMDERVGKIMDGLPYEERQRREVALNAVADREARWMRFYESAWNALVKNFAQTTNHTDDQLAFRAAEMADAAMVPIDRRIQAKKLTMRDIIIGDADVSVYGFGDKESKST